MLKSIYKKVIFSYPLAVFAVLLAVLGFLGVQATKLEVDASSKTLVMEGDKDFAFTQKVAKRFHTPNSLVIAFQPKEDLLSDKSLDAIESLTNELQKLEQINSITSILNVPLLISSDKPIKELIDDIPTLVTSDIDKSLAKKEFSKNPLYKENLVSKNFSTTAILLNLKEDSTLKKLIQKKDALQEGSAEFEKIQTQIKNHRDKERLENHLFIKEVRATLQEYKEHGKLYLGGVNMVADDLITFIKNDLVLYGSTLLLLLIIVLWLIFKEPRWVILPVVICLASIVATTGLLGLFGWEVTVISSNFIALQLIITISIVLHLIVRYRELALLHPKWNQEELVWETIKSKASPSFFAILTTIVGFSSLIFSSILPVINLGWMMSGGIAMSLLIAFIIFPIVLLKLPTSVPKTSFERHFAFTKVLANTVDKHGNKILLGSIFILIFSLSGASKLIVENSFINYFKSSTEIHKGMVVIDKYLGGTTPLDVIVTFKDDKEESAQAQDSDGFDEFASFDDELNSNAKENQYWFTPSKMRKIMEIHEYLDNKKAIGNVQSFATVLQIGKILNDGKSLDNFQLALLHNELPQEFKKIILSPYLNIEENQVRFATRVRDSLPDLRRDALLSSLDKDLEAMIPKEMAEHRLSNLMVLYNNMLQSLFESQILTLGIVLVLILAMFWAIFHSFKVALIALVSNIVPMSIIFGFMGWFKIPLDMMTITIAAISLGIGVDDTIHYIHRFKEEFAKDRDYVQAMFRSHNSIGYAMYYTSFSIILGFSVLMLSNFIPTIYFGLLTVLVMSMALLGALLLLPRLFIKFKPL